MYVHVDTYIYTRMYERKDVCMHVKFVSCGKNKNMNVNQVRPHYLPKLPPVHSSIQKLDSFSKCLDIVSTPPGLVYVLSFLYTTPITLLQPYPL